MGDMLGLRMNKQVSNSDACLRQSTGSLSLAPYCGTAVCGIPYQGCKRLSGKKAHGKASTSVAGREKETDGISRCS